MGEELAYGSCRKMTNLSLKRTALWHEFSVDQRNIIINYLHIPFDRFSLVTIRNCSPIKIPKNPTMSFVGNKEMYDTLQDTCKKIATQAGVPPIYIDILAWDMQH